MLKMLRIIPEERVNIWDIVNDPYFGKAKIPWESPFERLDNIGFRQIGKISIDPESRKKALILVRDSLNPSFIDNPEDIWFSTANLFDWMISQYPVGTKDLNVLVAVCIYISFSQMGVSIFPRLLAQLFKYTEDDFLEWYLFVHDAIKFSPIVATEIDCLKAIDQVLVARGATSQEAYTKAKLYLIRSVLPIKGRTYHPYELAKTSYHMGLLHVKLPGIPGPINSDLIALIWGPYKITFQEFLDQLT